MFVCRRQERKIKKRYINQNSSYMKKNIRLFFALASLFTLMIVLPASGQAPPPPSHSQNGNQASPGGTGCPIDQTEGILLALIVSLGYGGFALYRSVKQAGA
jgi:hypothetical protein